MVVYARVNMVGAQRSMGGPVPDLQRGEALGGLGGGLRNPTFVPKSPSNGWTDLSRYPTLLPYMVYERVDRTPTLPGIIRGPYLTRSHSGPLRPHFFLLRGFPFGSSDSFSYRFRAHLPECSI